MEMEKTGDVDTLGGGAGWNGFRRGVCGSGLFAEFLFYIFDYLGGFFLILRVRRN